MSENLKILGFDIGISSIGWAFVENNNLKDCGVRILQRLKIKTAPRLHFLAAKLEGLDAA